MTVRRTIRSRIVLCAPAPEGAGVGARTKTKKITEGLRRRVVASRLPPAAIVREWSARAYPATSYSLVHGDAFEWLAKRPANSVHAVVTDPPYGLVEYMPDQLAKMREGRGGYGGFRPPSTATHARLSLGLPS